MKRHKELLGDGLEFSPVNLLGGFICVDFHVGCAGCRYCLNRRHPRLHDILEKNLHFDHRLSPQEMMDLLRRLPSFVRARVPVRCGHLTDWAFQKRPSMELARLAGDHPFVILTRFPLDREQARFLRPNLLVHVSLSTISESDPMETLDSTRGLPREVVFYMLRPLAAGALEGTRRILQALPAGSRVGFHGLSTDAIPGMEGSESLGPDEMGELRSTALSLGLDVVPYFGCVLRERLGVPFFKFEEVRREAGSRCPRCANRARCEAAIRSTEADRIREELERLELAPRSIEWSGTMFRIEVAAPAARAEEVYLSELLHREVRLSTVVREPEAGVRFLPEAVLERWERVGFLPVEALRCHSRAAVEGLR